jgi:hypothetical protein
MHHHASCVFALSLALPLALSPLACGDSGPTAPMAEAGEGEAAGALSVRDGVFDPASVAEPAVSGDAQVLHVLLTMHGSEMALLEELLPALHGRTRDFAMLLHDDHAAAIQDVREVTNAYGFVLEPSDVSLTLRRRAHDNTRRLREAKAHEVDALFIAHELRVQRFALHLIDDVLAPAAHKDDVRALLQDTRAVIHRRALLATQLHSEGRAR